MICNVILFYTIIFLDNSKINREKWLDKQTASDMVSLMVVPNKDPNVQKLYESAHIKKFDAIKIVEVPEYNCKEGPKQESGVKL